MKIIMPIGVALVLVAASAVFLAGNTAYAAALTLSPNSGPPDTIVTVNGSGMAGSTTNIYFDKLSVDSKVRIAENGQFTATFKVPDSVRGTHIVRAVDNAFPQSTFVETEFTVTPKIRVDPAVGLAGHTITVIGSGFANREQGVQVLFDGRVISSSPVVSFNGDWGTTFVPTGDAKGEHIVDAYGVVTSAKEVPDFTFILGPYYVFEPRQGPPGTIMKFAGWGFHQAEDGIEVSFDGELIAFNIVGEANGSWTKEVLVPEAPAGAHQILSFGTFTSGAPYFTFTVTPAIEASPSLQKTGDPVTITGSGFAANQTVKLTFGKSDAGTAKTNSKGSFSQTVQVPQVDGSANEITAVDGSGKSARANYVTAAVVKPPPPPVLDPISPMNDVKLTIFESAAEAASKILSFYASALPVSFSWGGTANPAGGTYNLQVANTRDFSPLLVDKTGVTETKYTLSTKEALERGAYFWRVRAVDPAGTAGPWTEARQFKVELMGSSDLIILISAVVVIAVLVIFAFTYLIRQRIRI